MSFTQAERKTLADLNYIARVNYKNQITAGLTERLRLLSVALIENNYLTVSDPNKAELVSIMASTPDGIWWRAQLDANGQNLLDRLAAELGVVIYPWTPPAITPPQPASSQPSPGTALLPAAGRNRGEFKKWEGAKDIVVFEASPNTLPTTRVLDGITVIPKGGKLSIGGDAYDADASLQVHGTGSAEILVSSNEEGLDKQNVIHRHVGVFKMGNDNSMGMLVNAFYRNGKAIRTDPTRAVSALHFDSMGWLSINREWYDGNDSRSQRIVIAYSEKRRCWVIGLPAAGEGLVIRRSQSTNDWGNINEPDCPGGELVVVEPLPI